MSYLDPGPVPEVLNIRQIRHMQGLALQFERDPSNKTLADAVARAFPQVLADVLTWRSLAVDARDVADNLAVGKCGHKYADTIAPNVIRRVSAALDASNQ